MLARSHVRRRLLAAAAMSVTLCSCVDGIEEERSRIGDVIQDCVVPLSAHVSGWGAPVSLEYPDGSAWLWDSVALDDGSQVRNVLALVHSASAACAGQF